GRLIFTTMQGLRAVNAATGADKEGWHQPCDGSQLAPFGRGLLVGDLVLWPTRAGLRVVRQQDGERPEDLNPVWIDQVPPGNLAAASGCLVVATAEVLLVYLPESRLLEQRRQDARRQPRSAPVRYRLGLSEADVGLEAEALESFTQAEQAAK